MSIVASNGQSIISQSHGSVWLLDGLERIKKRQRREQTLVLPALRLLQVASLPHQQCRVCPCRAPCTLCVDLLPASLQVGRQGQVVQFGI